MCYGDGFLELGDVFVSCWVCSLVMCFVVLCGCEVVGYLFLYVWYVWVLFKLYVLLFDIDVMDVFWFVYDMVIVLEGCG